MDIELVKSFFLKYLLIPLIIVVLIVVLVFLKKKLSFVKPKTLFLYILVASILLALPGLLGFSGNMFNPYWYVLASMVYFLLGIWHVNQIQKRFHNSEVAIWVRISFEVVISLISMGLGTYLFSFLFNWLSPYDGYAYISATSILVFIVPLLFYYSYIQFLNIPFSIYKTWQYDGNKVPVDFDGIDYNKLMVVNIELAKNTDDGSRFRIKAKTLSKGISFGDWFHRLIEDYNYKNAQAKIVLKDKDNSSYSWVFYTKKSIFHRRRYVDFDRDIESNKIRENDLVICKRVVENKQED